MEPEGEEEGEEAQADTEERGKGANILDFFVCNNVFEKW